MSAERPELRAAASYFAEVWAELIENLPDDYDCQMTCVEANAVVELYRALGSNSTAAGILAAHARYDQDGDQHYTPEPTP